VTLFGFLRALIAGIAWLVLAALLALGGAGVAAALNHTPGTAARLELTFTADQAAKPAIDGAAAQLAGLGDAVDRLGIAGRDALTSLVGGDTAGLQAALDAGTARLDSVHAASDALAGALAAVPYVTGHSELYLAPSLATRYDQLVKARTLVSGLADNWAMFSEQALDASKVPALLTQHDAVAASAARQGSAGKYPQALKLLDGADSAMVQARALRDRLAKKADVTTLTAWLNANAAYDGSLRSLYQTMRDAKGKVNDAVRKAFAAELAARAALPKDTKGIIVIMNDIARGGLNQAVIAIDTTKGLISKVLEQGQ
jgi:hypothetical protein